MSEPRKLDEISEAIGALRAEVRVLGDGVRDRHRENSRRLEGIENRLSGVEMMIQPLKEAVQTFRPLIDSMQQSRWQVAGGMTVLTALLMTLGWLMWAFAGKITAIIVSIFAAARGH